MKLGEPPQKKPKDSFANIPKIKKAASLHDDDESVPGSRAASDEGSVKDVQKSRSHHSVGSSQNSSQAGRNGREISETLSNKFYEMKWCLLALASNIALIIFIANLESGLIIGADEETVQMVGGIMLEIVLLVSNILSIKALDNGFQVFYGNIMASKGTAIVAHKSLSRFRRKYGCMWVRPEKFYPKMVLCR